MADDPNACEIINIATRRNVVLPDWQQPETSWRHAMARLRLADAAEDLAFAEYMHLVETVGEDDPAALAASQAFRDSHWPRLVAISRAMMTPAPHHHALKWKHDRRNAGGGSHFWEAQIARDSDRLSAAKKRRG